MLATSREQEERETNTNKEWVEYVQTMVTEQYNKYIKHDRGNGN